MPNGKVIKFEELNRIIGYHLQLAWFYEDDYDQTKENCEVSRVLHNLIDALCDYDRNYEKTVLENRVEFIARIKKDRKTIAGNKIYDF